MKIAQIKLIVNGCVDAKSHKMLAGHNILFKSLLNVLNKLYCKSLLTLRGFIEFSRPIKQTNLSDRWSPFYAVICDYTNEQIESTSIFMRWNVWRGKCHRGVTKLISHVSAYVWSSFMSFKIFFPVFCHILLCEQIYTIRKISYWLRNLLYLIEIK